MIAGYRLRGNTNLNVLPAAAGIDPIASIRRMLVITLESSQVGQASRLAPDGRALLNATMLLITWIQAAQLVSA